MREINKAMAAINQHDACDDCGKRTDGLMTCTFAHDGSTTKLCPDCMKDSGFCLMCGNYCAGISSFDFSDMPGYCSDCRDEIKLDEQRYRDLSERNNIVRQWGKIYVEGWNEHFFQIIPTPQVAKVADIGGQNSTIINRKLLPKNEDDG